MIDFRFGTSFRNNLTNEEEAALDHLLDMMTAIKQQIFLRRAMNIDKNCVDCINADGDWECDHVHCYKGEKYEDM